MRIAAATIAVTIAAGVVGFVAADHTLPDSRELRQVSVDFVPSGATDLDTRMSVGPQITAGPPRGFTTWRNGLSFDVILTKARKDGWEVKTQQTLPEAQLATIVRGPISATITVAQSGDGIANVTRDEESMNLRRRGAAVAGGAIGLFAMTIQRRRKHTPAAAAPTPSAPA